MSKFSLYDCEGYFVREVVANSPEEAFELLGVTEDTADLMSLEDLKNECDLNALESQSPE